MKAKNIDIINVFGLHIFSLLLFGVCHYPASVTLGYVLYLLT